MSDKKKPRPGKRFIDKYKQGQDFSASMKAGRESNVELRPNISSNFTKIPNSNEAFSQAVSAGLASPISISNKKSKKPYEPMAFRMPPFPKKPKDMDGDGDTDSNDYLAAKDKAIKEAMGKGVTRYIEGEDGVLKRETLLPKNKMGSIALKADPMPMAYKYKVVKKTAGAKAIPFTAK